MYSAKYLQSGVSRTIVIVLCLLAAGLGLFANFWWQQRQQSQSAPLVLHNGTYLYDQNTTMPDTQLIDHHGQTTTISSLKDNWYFWFFGFTHCPDICPMTLSTLTAVTQKIQSAHTTPIKIVFVTVDPERDTPTRMREYLSAFDSTAIGLTGEPSALEALRTKLGIIAVKIDLPESESGTTFDHSSAVYLTAPDGKIAALFPAPHKIKLLAADVDSIAKRVEKE